MNQLNKCKMDPKNQKSNPDEKKLDEKDKNAIPDSLLYPANEDIYSQFKKESDIDPEDVSKNKVPVEINNTTEMNEKDFSDDVSGADLDVPGSELDDEQEKLGSEDEENNYYSIGGDNHNDLEESKGD